MLNIEDIRQTVDIPREHEAAFHFLETVLRRQGESIADLRIAQAGTTDNPADGYFHLIGHLIPPDSRHSSPPLDIVFHHMCIQAESRLVGVNRTVISAHFDDFIAKLPRDPLAHENVFVAESWIDLIREQPIFPHHLIVGFFLRYDAPLESLFHEFATMAREYHPIRKFAAEYRASV